MNISAGAILVLLSLYSSMYLDRLSGTSELIKDLFEPGHFILYGFFEDKFKNC